jgi:MoxR-like ATPase
LAHAVRLLRAAGIEWTDRRVVRVQRLIAAAAVLAGRATPNNADLWPIVFALPTEQAQRTGRDVLRDLLAVSDNGSLLAAAAEGSLGPLARGAKILHEGQKALAARPAAADQTAWRLQLESVARDIDASFAPDARPADLDALRTQLLEHLTPPEGA